MKRLHGFTMVEMVAVIAIVGILAVMLAPRFFDRYAFERRGFYDQVISTLRYAQKAAITQNRFVCASFSANSLALTYDPTPPSATHTAMAACPGGSALVGPNLQTTYIISSSNASFSPTPSPSAFYFDALGRTSLSARQTINIANVSNPIYVEAETGYVH